MKSLINHFKASHIPTWINIVQILLTMIVIQQTYQFYFDIDAVSASGITTEGIPNRNLIYEFAGRTGTMAMISILILLSQNVKLFIIMFAMNVFNLDLENSGELRILLDTTKIDHTISSKTI